MLNECIHTVNIRKMLSEDIEPLSIGGDRPVCHAFKHGQSSFMVVVNYKNISGQIPGKDPPALKPTLVQK